MGKIPEGSVRKPCCLRRGLVWMFFKRDYRVENWEGQVERCSLMCKERIRHRVDLTGLCSLCAEEPINWVHAGHLHVHIWCMHMLPQAQSACANNNVLINTSASADQCWRIRLIEECVLQLQDEKWQHENNAMTSAGGQRNTPMMSHKYTHPRVLTAALITLPSFVVV